METNRISEIFPGHFQTILDFPTAKDLERIVDRSCKYVWVIEHFEIRNLWKPYPSSIYGEKNFHNEVFARNMKMEYLIDSVSFLQLVPKINQTIHMIQVEKKPAYYLNLDRLKGKAKYDLLKRETNYKLEIIMPGSADFTPLVSPDRIYLESVIRKFS